MDVDGRVGGGDLIVVTPEYTSQARARLGDDTTLAVEQLMVVETDRSEREKSRGATRLPEQVPCLPGELSSDGL
jgi:hypothetical protein